MYRKNDDEELYWISLMGMGKGKGINEMSGDF
jgi:hypothetical protein